MRGWRAWLRCAIANKDWVEEHGRKSIERAAWEVEHGKWSMKGHGTACEGEEHGMRSTFVAAGARLRFRLVGKVPRRTRVRVS